MRLTSRGIIRLHAMTIIFFFLEIEIIKVHNNKRCISKRIGLEEMILHAEVYEVYAASRG